MQQGCTDGQYPYAGVLRVKNELFATDSIGGSGNNGTVVSVNRKTLAGKVVYTFENYYGDARGPETGLIDVNGKLYGTTAGGGLGYGGNGAGTVYLLNPKAGKDRVLYSFCSEQNCADGAVPSGNLLELNGKFYGVTFGGDGGVQGCYGPYAGCGTVYSFDLARGREKVLYVFCAQESCADGSGPSGDLVAVNGLLYGTTTGSGSGTGCSDMGLGCGTVFSLDPATRRETVLHAFGGATDGGTPAAGLINVDGVLYGTTEYGGSTSYCPDGYEEGCGTVYSIDPASGAETIVHVFKADGKDGEMPISELLAVNGTLYGTAQYGGTNDYGTVFAIDLASGKEKTLYSFCNEQRCNDGASPYAGVIEIDGKLYGTTEAGGAGDQGFAIGGGTIFSLKP